MQVSHQFHQKPLQKAFDTKQGHPNQVQESQNENLKTKITQGLDKKQEVKLENKERQTYGFIVLQLMSDPEYKAFERATADMSEGDKIMAAQSLYSLTSFYGGKLQDFRNEQKQAPYVQNQDFITRYKNALAAAQSQIDINS